MIICSFDIFDTLLLRPFIDPQEVWVLLEEKEHVKGFAAQRKQVDAKTFADSIANNTETTLDASYQLLPSEWNYLKQKEMDLELSLLTPNPEMKKIWDKAKAEGCKRIVVSDMYMPKTFIEQVLAKNGFGDWDELYLSSEKKVRKSSGLLFKQMLQELHVNPSDVAHWGDNPVSDVQIPDSLGIITHPYKRISEKFFEAFPFAQFVDCRLAGALALGWHLYENQYKDEFGKEPTYWNRLGFIMGGVLGYMYVHWIVSTCRKKNIDRLLFIARDGYILQKICNELYPEIKTEYIYAPRLTSIAVLGPIGSDPSAVKERQDYYDSIFKQCDKDTVAKEYASYIEQFHIDDHTAIVDGCSSCFSAQRMIEKSLNNDVFFFYLLSMSHHRHATALYSTQLYSLPFQSLSEFLFGSPEKPIIGIKNGAPEYENDISAPESFKIAVCPELAHGTVAAAKFLHRYDVNVSPKIWSQYSDSFMSHLTETDKRFLEKAQNATDVRQKHFESVIWIPKIKDESFRFTKCGTRSFKVVLKLFGRLIAFHVSRHGVHIRLEKVL